MTAVSRNDFAAVSKHIMTSTGIVEKLNNGKVERTLYF